MRLLFALIGVLGLAWAGHAQPLSSYATTNALRGADFIPLASASTGTNTNYKIAWSNVVARMLTNIVAGTNIVLQTNGTRLTINSSASGGGGGGTNPTNLPGTGILITTNNANSHTFTADTNTLATRAYLNAVSNVLQVAIDGIDIGTNGLFILPGTGITVATNGSDRTISADTNTLATRAWATAADTIVSNGAVATAAANTLSVSNTLVNGFGIADQSVNLETLENLRQELRKPTRVFTVLSIGDSYANTAGTPLERAKTFLQLNKGTNGAAIASINNLLLYSYEGSAALDTSGVWPNYAVTLPPGTNNAIMWTNTLNGGQGLPSTFGGLIWLAHPNGTNFTFKVSGNGGSFSTLGTLDGYSATNVIRTTNFNFGFSTVDTFANARLRVENGVGATNYIIGPLYSQTYQHGFRDMTWQVDGLILTNYNRFPRHYYDNILSLTQPDLIIISALDTAAEWWTTLGDSGTLRGALTNYNRPVVLLGPPPYEDSTTPALAAAALRSIAVSNHWAFLDLHYGITNNADATNRGWFVAGDVHPTAAGDTNLASRIYDALFKEAVSERQGAEFSLVELHAQGTKTNHAARLWDITTNLVTHKRETLALFASGATNATTTGTNLMMVIPYNCSIEVANVMAAVNRHIPPTGSQMRFRLQTNGVSILSTDLHIDANETTSLTAATNFAFSTTNLLRGSFLELNVIEVGSTVAGAGAHVWVPVRETP